MAFWQVEEVNLALIIRIAHCHGTTASRQRDVSRQLANTVPERNPHSHPADHLPGVELRRSRSHNQKQDST
jgi:hypothetical protein